MSFLRALLVYSDPPNRREKGGNSVLTGLPSFNEALPCKSRRLDDKSWNSSRCKEYRAISLEAFPDADGAPVGITSCARVYGMSDLDDGHIIIQYKKKKK